MGKDMTLSEILADATVQSINSTGSFNAQVRNNQVKNCYTMINAGISPDTQYLEAKRLYCEKYPDKNLIKA